jgi:hypothetical protein
METGGTPECDDSVDMTGSPGTGKAMLAKRLPTILPADEGLPAAGPPAPAGSLIDAGRDGPHVLG